MSDATDRAGDDGLSEQERDAMVASLLGITTDRLRTMRRVHRKRLQADEEPEGGGAPPRWRCVDELDDDALFDEFRRREVRARAAGRPHLASPVDRQLRRTARRR